MSKRVKAVLTLQLPAGKATAAQPVGPALGQHGINIMGFVKEYNERTASQMGNIVPAEITVYEDRSFTFIIKTPPATDLLKKAAGVDKGTSTAGKATAGQITKKQLRDIAEMKMKDLNANDVEAAMRMVEGSARSMGVAVSD